MCVIIGAAETTLAATAITVDNMCLYTFFSIMRSIAFVVQMPKCMPIFVKEGKVRTNKKKNRKFPYSFVHAIPTHSSKLPILTHRQREEMKLCMCASRVCYAWMCSPSVCLWETLLLSFWQRRLQSFHFASFAYYLQLNLIHHYIYKRGSESNSKEMKIVWKRLYFSHKT